MTEPTSGRAGGAGGRPRVAIRIVSPASVVVAPAPYNHFTLGPDCGVFVSASGDIRQTCGCPNAGERIVSSAGIHKAEAVISAPNDHFSARPDCAV